MGNLYRPVHRTKFVPIFPPRNNWRPGGNKRVEPCRHRSRCRREVLMAKPICCRNGNRLLPLNKKIWVLRAATRPIGCPSRRLYRTSRRIKTAVLGTRPVPTQENHVKIASSVHKRPTTNGTVINVRAPIQTLFDVGSFLVWWKTRLVVLGYHSSMNKRKHYLV